MLYDKYASILLGFILKIAGDKKTAETLLQGTFIRIKNNVKNFNPSQERFFIWMIKIARTTAEEAKASTKENQVAEIPGHTNLVYKAGNGMPINDSNTEIVSPEVDRDRFVVLDLIYFKGYTNEQAAKELSITLNELKTRLRSELLQLRGKK